MIRMKNIKIANKIVGHRKSVFIIAEIGCNFENDFSRAVEMIEKASEAGVDAVKFQTFNPDTLVTKTAPKFWDIKGCPGETQFEEFSQMYRLNFSQYKELKKIADCLGIIFFSTPSDEESGDMLEELGVPVYKVASMDITNIPFLKYIAKKKKPIILSTGASTIQEIKEAVKAIESEGNKKIILFHCITNYPTNISNVNMAMMQDIQRHFSSYPVGYSDHTKMPESLAVILAAVGCGAKVIEKHFTFDKNRPGYDHEISADYKDMEEIVKNIRIVENIFGNNVKAPIPGEKRARKFGRRSIVAKVDIRKGMTISKEMLIIKRPGTGIEPKFLDRVIGKIAKKTIKADTVLKWEMLR
ncbi:MAG TPA: N-acetylneuraminate synthase family protein [Victivallales bacterium]|nr:N-acetylneuraminate synthase family protein [Victivallales bacterium]